jgi:glucosamine--fructose-6-phosphate aminotransferase (isomerizing)
MQEVIARGGKVILITNGSTNIISENIRFTLEIPKTDDNLTPFLMTIPLQLLAYHVASLKNYDVDKPRNLAKSVTVE